MPCTKPEIEELEKRLETTLPVSLKQFYLVFGVAGIGEELMELKEIEYLEKIWHLIHSMDQDLGVTLFDNF
ncbi:SMI1/KNR4 family protein [Myroides sp. M-43]|uniref:SMI1/KNR4 family protein n=1 Tax=Myroides oncorhynchi TaxID=2893756 RepID=UPI001E556DAE|nr:SMI1/KNR4 family protein [Myroides oncorhynchi]